MIDLRDLRDDRGEREPTVRDFMEFSRHVRERGQCGRDHEPYDACMAWSEMDWGAATGRSPRASRPRPDDRPPEGSMIFTATEKLDRKFSTDPDIVNRCREHLVARVQRWCDLHGYRVERSVWSTNPPSDVNAPVEMRLEAVLMPRTDGEWDAIRQAIAEDEADRAAAKDVSASVNDRLDALAASVGVWSARSPAEVREALREA